MVAEISVWLLDNDGSIISDPVNGAPCIQVGFYSGTPAEKAGSPVELVWALLDTGADHGYVDAALLAKTKAPVVGSATVNASARENLHQGVVYLPSVNFHLTGVFISRDFMTQRSGYQIVLGRQFFTAARFEFGVGNPRLVWHGPSAS